MVICKNNFFNDENKDQNNLFYYVITDHVRTVPSMAWKFLQLLSREIMEYVFPKIYKQLIFTSTYTLGCTQILKLNFISE